MVNRCNCKIILINKGKTGSMINNLSMNLFKLMMNYQK